MHADHHEALVLVLFGAKRARRAGAFRAVDAASRSRSRPAPPCRATASAAERRRVEPARSRRSAPTTRVFSSGRARAEGIVRACDLHPSPAVVRSQRAWRCVRGHWLRAASISCLLDGVASGADRPLARQPVRCPALAPSPATPSEHRSHRPPCAPTRRCASEPFMRCEEARAQPQGGAPARSRRRHA